MPPSPPIFVEKPSNEEVPSPSNVSSSSDWVANRLEFSWSETDEPHASRRKLILSKHPEIRQLFGREPRTFYITIGILCVQLLMCYLVKDLHLGWLMLLAYVVGGTANHSLLMIGHELSHNLCFEGNTNNQLLAIVANFATGIPSAITFKRYHMEHHQLQGCTSFRCRCSIFVYSPSLMFLPCC